MKCEEIVVRLKKEDNLAYSKLLVFCDASFASMAGSGSQRGYIIFRPFREKRAIARARTQTPAKVFRSVINCTCESNF